MAGCRIRCGTASGTSSTLLCRFLAAVGHRLGQAVVMTAECDYGNPVIGSDPSVDRVVLLADPQLT